MSTAKNHPVSTNRLLKSVLSLGVLVSLPAAAADWSDTSLGWRYGTSFRESYVNKQNGTAQNITKNIVDFSHTSGYRYGINFFDVDLLMSDNTDPANCQNFNCTGSAQEAYVVYRNNIEYGKVFGRAASFPGVKDMAFTVGFDWNTKNDAGYESKKRMFVWGPTFELKVPGYMNVGVWGVNDSNAPCTSMPPQAVGYPPNGCYARYYYKLHPMLTSSWAIPIMKLPLSYEGYFNYIGTKGANEFGGPTKPETNWDSEIMLDAGDLLHGPKSTFKVGFEFQFWENKYGNDHAGPAGPGAFARTPMARVEYHF